MWQIREYNYFYLREYETKYEFEKASNKRLEAQNSRLKDQLEKTSEARNQDISEKDREKDAAKKSKKALAEAREDKDDAERKLRESKESFHFFSEFKLLWNFWKIITKNIVLPMKTHSG